MEPANDSNINEAPEPNNIKPKKDWREISKLQGLLYSLVIVLLYTIARWWLFTQHGHFLIVIYISVVLFFIGFALGLFENIEPGTSDTLVYCGKLLKGHEKEWEDGYVFLPSPIPFMHRLKFRPMWSLLNKHWKVKTVNENGAVFRHDVRVNGLDQHRINTNATLLEAAVFQGGKISWNWFWSMDGDAHYAFQEFGLKIIIVAVLLDCFNLGTTGAINAYDYIFSSSEKAIALQSSQNTQSNTTKKQPEQNMEDKIYLTKDGGLVIKDGNNFAVMKPTFQTQGNQSVRSNCEWTETDWDVDLVVHFLDFSNRSGCIDFHPQNGKQIGMLFSSKPTKTSGDFKVTIKETGEGCYLDPNDDCLHFINSHLNEVLVYEGSHIYIDIGK